MVNVGLFDCSGKVALITGGNSGLGLGFATGIAKMGGDIALWSNAPEKDADARAALIAAGAGRVECYEIDVRSEDLVTAGYQRLMQDFGRLDCVIANAGQPPSSRSFLEMDSEVWHGLLATNFHGAFYTLREGARLMVARSEAGEPGGSLVFCGSLSMFQGYMGTSDYTAAKGGIGAVIRTIAAELGRYGIRANTVAPGYTSTGIMAQLEPQRRAAIDAHFASRTPIPRSGHAEDFEGIGAYLCSDASRFHSGDTIVIDGGSLIYPGTAAAARK